MSEKLHTGRTGTTSWNEAGAGPAVVLLHGLGGDIDFWRAEQDALAATHRVIAVDLNGRGATEFAISDLADDVLAVLDHLRIGRAAIVGFSLGGLVALEFASVNPGRVTQLVLASTYAVMNTQARLFLDAVQSTYARSCSAKEVFDLICPWLFSVPFLENPSNAPAVRYDDDALNIAEMQAWSALYRAQRAFDHRPSLSVIIAPTLVIAGSHDALVSRADAELLRDEIPDSRLQIVEGSGHLTNVERPRDFLAALKNHLGSTHH